MYVRTAIYAGTDKDGAPEGYTCTGIIPSRSYVLALTNTDLAQDSLF